MNYKVVLKTGYPPSRVWRLLYLSDINCIIVISAFKPNTSLLQHSYTLYVDIPQIATDIQ